MQPSNYGTGEQPLADEATIVCCGYNIGYFSKNDIERWADEQIAAIDIPDNVLIELSMIRETHPVDVMNLLNSLVKPLSPARIVAVQIGFIGLCYIGGKVSLLDAIRGLYALVDAIGISNEEKGKIYWLDDAYDLAVAGYHGSIDEVETELRQFVSPYVAELQEFHKRLLHQRAD